MSSNGFEPRIVGFLCNWCSYQGADMAGTARMQYAPNLSIIRVNCSGRVDPSFILKAFSEGADGVLVAGCGAALVSLALYLIFGNSAVVMARLGRIGTLVMVRLMAFILLCIGIQIMWTGWAELNGIG